ncbi:MAG: 4Fe-4S dicluster domain-containing protein [Kiritimatiellaeota bacterium]|nr:4Fe-4S dicluster domain-containing protein [Kiritimatiellota bacterium]
MTALLLSLGPHDALAADSREQVAARASVAPGSVIEITGLASQAFEKEIPALAQAIAHGGDVVIGASRPRAAQALLDYAAVDMRACRVTWVQVPFDRDALRRGYGTPWFPVIDRTRCTGCGTCADYCLFSVYAVDEALPPSGKIRVAMPQYCKIGCPACARLCPAGALIFPFCAEAELNGEIAAPPQRTQEDALAALGDDPMRILAERRAKRRLIDPAKFDQAERDRITFSGIL